jgi:hypothetical protein
MAARTQPGIGVSSSSRAIAQVAERRLRSPWSQNFPRATERRAETRRRLATRAARGREARPMAVSAYLVKRRPRCRRSYQSDEDDGVHCDDHHSGYRGRCDAHPDHSQDNPHSAEEERADMSTPGQPPHRPPCPYAPARNYRDHDAGTDGPPADWRIANGVVHYAWEAAAAAEKHASATAV